MKKLILSLSLLAAFSAHAGTVANSLVAPGGIYKMPNGVVQIQMAGASTGHPSCGSANNSRYTIDTSTNAGKQQIASIETAKALGLTMTVVGNNTCPAGIHPNIENVDHVYY